MLRCASVTAFLWLVLATTGAWAAELTGFGPIKFGMSKDEAWAAIDGKGKWERNGKWLRYEHALDDRVGSNIILSDLKFEVVQTFHDDLALDVIVEITASTIFSPACATEMYYFVSAIQHKYGKPTLVRDDVVDLDQGKKGIRPGATSFRIFAFDDEALIRIVLSTWEGEPPGWNCSLQIWYHPPVSDPIPF